MTPAQVAAELTHHVFGDENGDERESFLAKVEEGARVYGVRGSTVSGTASTDVLVQHLFSSLADADKTLRAHKASCLDWLLSMR